MGLFTYLSLEKKQAMLQITALCLHANTGRNHLACFGLIK